MREQASPDHKEISSRNHSQHASLLESLAHENAWWPQPQGSPGSDYETRLLSPPTQAGDAWWRQSNALPPSELLADQAVAFLRQALAQASKNESPGAVIETTLELQKMARALLRIGAWKLLRPVLRMLLDQLRSGLPSPRRMSQATGLTAEWALAAVRPRVAFIYNQESLAWGCEPHRIRSYLAYARACLNPESMRDELDLSLSMHATERQESLSGRTIFNELHQIRLNCLALLVGPVGSTEVDRDAIQRQFQAFFDRHSTDEPKPSAATHLVTCAAAAIKGLLADISVSEGAVDSSLRFLAETGRWRDRQLLHQIAPSRFAPLSSQESDLVEGLNQTAASVPTDDFETPDSPYLASLPPTVEQPSVREALIAFLCCI